MSVLLIPPFSIDINREENVLMCRGLIDFIVDSAFDIIEANKNEEKSTLINSTKNTKIQVHSNIVIKPKINNEAEIWEKHLHWPHHDEKSKTRKCVKEKMPFAITSSKWVNYYGQQENAKKEKEEEIKRRKLIREEKKNQTEANKKRGSKTKHGGKENCDIKSKVKVTEDMLANDMKIEILHKDHSETPETLDVGDYVIVEYDNKQYPGLIKATDDESYEVSVMEETFNKKWRWPKPVDQIWYHKNQIIKKITEPKPFNSRGLYVTELMNDNN